MRKLPSRWTGRFDAVLDLFTSFGFFLDPADDARVVREFARVLQPGGALVWHGGRRGGLTARLPGSEWWKCEDGPIGGQEGSLPPASGGSTCRAALEGP